MRLEASQVRERCLYSLPVFFLHLLLSSHPDFCFNFCLPFTVLKSFLKVNLTPAKRTRPEASGEAPKGQSEEGFELSEAEHIFQEGFPFAREMVAGPIFDPEKMLKINGKIETRRTSRAAEGGERTDADGLD